MVASGRVPCSRAIGYGKLMAPDIGPKGPWVQQVRARGRHNLAMVLSGCRRVWISPSPFFLRDGDMGMRNRG